jgi:hypothetical protein
MLCALRSPRAARTLLLALLLAALLPACVVLDVRAGEGESGVTSTRFHRRLRDGGLARGRFDPEDRAVRRPELGRDPVRADLEARCARRWASSARRWASGRWTPASACCSTGPHPPRYEHAEEPKPAPPASQLRRPTRA